MHMNEEKVVNVALKMPMVMWIQKHLKNFLRPLCLKGMDPKVGMVLQATAPDGSKFPAVISQINGDKVVLNFNHPLAGKH